MRIFCESVRWLFCFIFQSTNKSHILSFHISVELNEILDEKSNSIYLTKIAPRRKEFCSCILHRPDKIIFPSIFFLLCKKMPSFWYFIRLDGWMMVDMVPLPGSKSLFFEFQFLCFNFRVNSSRVLKQFEHLYLLTPFRLELKWFTIEICYFIFLP